MSNILPILNLNKQPTSVKDRILLDAENIRFEKDGKTITNIEDLENLNIVDKLIEILNTESVKEAAGRDYIESEDKYQDFVPARLHIVHILPCNTELVLFVYYNETIIPSGVKYQNSFIFRYNEKLDSVKLNYIDFDYIGGKTTLSYSKFSSTFTYNYNNELIIAFCEYDAKEDCPLKTINLGRWEDIDNYQQIDNKLLPISPIIDLPTVALNYCNGALYKGDYTFYIRFKIGNNDYTQWYDLLKTFTLNNSSAKNVFNYTTLKDRGANKPSDVELVNASAFEYISDEYELCYNSINININNIDANCKSYQLGFICKTKTNTIVKRTSDINSKTDSYIFNIKYLYDCLEEDLIKTYINYFNVKKLYNYNNKLYIADYKESLFDNFDVHCNISVNEVDIPKLDNSGNESNNENIEELNDTYYQYNALVTTYAHLKDNKKSTIGSDIKIINKEAKENIAKLNENSDYINLVYFIRRFQQDVFYKNDSSDEWNSIWNKVMDSNVTLDELRKDNNLIFDVLQASGSYTALKEKGKGDSEKYACTVSLNGFSMSYNNKHLKNVKISNVNIADLEIKVFPLTSSLYKDYYVCDLFIIRDINTGAKIKGQITRGGLSYQPLDYHHVIFVKNDNKIKTNLDFRHKYNNYYTGRTVLFYNDTNFNIADNTKGTLSIIQNTNLSGFNKYIYAEYKSPDTVVDGDISIFTNIYTNTIENNILKDKFGNTFTNDLKGFSSNNYYGFYIHFLDKYNKISNGYKISVDDAHLLSNYNKDSDNKNNIILCDDFKKLFKVMLKIDISEFKYDRFFISYNSNKNNIFRGILDMDQSTGSTDEDRKYYIYGLDFTLQDKLSVNYNKMRIYSTFNKSVEYDIQDIKFEDMYSELLNTPFKDDDEDENENNYKDYDINNIALMQSDSEIKYNTPCYKVMAKGPVETRGNTDKYHFKQKNESDTSASIQTRLIVDLYNTDNRDIDDDVLKLIPCSRIYDINIDGNSDTNTIDVELFNENYYYTINSAYIFTDNIYYNSGTKTFDDIDNNGVPVISSKYINNSTIKVSNKPDIFIKYAFWDVQEFPYEYKQFNHEPQKVIIPGAGSDSKEPVDSNFISYVPGKIFESINIIDLYKNIHLPITESYAKYYTNYREDIVYLSEFTKTIRRSNIIQDESREVSWRFFEPNQYKMISENKGRITNIVGFGDILLIHTEHSLFMFRNQYSLQSDKDEEIALQNNDIWDLKYKEVVTDQLGYAGLQDNESYIAGQFGYIFYDNDAKTIYKFDEGKFDIISSDIEKYLKSNNISSIQMGEDKDNNIIFMVIKVKPMNETNQVLIYDYKNKAFISDLKHFVTMLEKTNYVVDGRYNKLINTKQKLYSFNTGNILYTIAKNRKDTCKFSVVVNTSIESIKYIESIMYKLRLVKDDKINSFDTFKEMIHPYAGDILKIQSEFCDTNDIDLKVNADAIASKYPENNCIDSSTGRYNKPYFHLGQWNFNTIRDTINNNAYGQEQSRVYGDWFIITFNFNNLNGNKLEFESLTVNLIEAK